MPEATFADAFGVVERVRLVKSEAEIALMREAAAITDKAVAAGFATVADFKNHSSAITDCPLCGNADTISETRIATFESQDDPALECGDCGAVWQP